MKHKKAFAAALCWVFALAIAGVFLMVTSDKESRESEAENRMLAGFPTLSIGNIFNDSFMTGFDSFLSDAFFSRDQVVSFTQGMLDKLNLLSEEERLAEKTKDMEAELEAGVGSAGAEDTEETQTEAEGEAETGADAGMTEQADEEEDGAEVVIAGNTLIDADKSYLWYDKADGTAKVSYTYYKTDIDTYADTLRIMQSYLPADGVICFTQPPLASMANTWIKTSSKFCGWGSSVEQMLTDSLEGTERIYAFNAFDILEQYIRTDTPMFYKDDHHWTPHAAWYVLKEMLEKQGMPVIDYYDYEYTSINAEGSKDVFEVMHPLYPVQSLVVDSGNEKEMGLHSYTRRTYRCFLNGTQLPWRRILSAAGTGRKALVLCDSFGNCFAPYLLAYYDEVHMADFRKGSYEKAKAGGSIGELIQKYGIDDVYIVASIANGLKKDNSLVWLRKYLTE